MFTSSSTLLTSGSVASAGAQRRSWNLWVARPAAVLVSALALGGALSLPAAAQSQSDEASLARGAVPDTTPQQRYQSAIREAGGGLKVSLEECRAMPTAERKGCESEARARYRAMLDLLAEHEFLVAHYYYRRGAWESARNRFAGLFASFPEYSAMEKALFWAGQTDHVLGRDADARAFFDRLRRDYPESRYLRKLPKLAQTPATATATTGL